jgi:hypothetical protein
VVGHPTSLRVHVERVVIHGRPVESEVLAAAIEHGLRASLGGSTPELTARAMPPRGRRIGAAVAVPVLAAAGLAGGDDKGPSR